jgi:hypothetical protein
MNCVIEQIGLNKQLLDVDISKNQLMVPVCPLIAQVQITTNASTLYLRYT